ncbi:MAG: substrate-binding domain-containing protein [Gammaproteobacteria bacterium]
MQKHFKKSLLTLLAGLLLLPQVGLAGENFILLQSTTSTQNSGLFDFLLPRYSAASGVEVRVVAVGTGQALRNAREGNGDVLMVHAKEAEEQFIAEGFGLHRYPVMFNDFVIVGPPEDPAGVHQAASAPDALTRIAAAQANFLTRGDDSGTHKRERALWAQASLLPAPGEAPWYKDVGSGMGRALQIAAEISGYTLSDRGTWVAVADPARLPVLFEGGAALRNQYSLIVVNPERHPHVKAAAAQAFVDWMLSADGQQTIAEFRLDGQQLFYPNAGRE